MSADRDKRVLKGSKPTPDDEAWLSYGTKLRENAAMAYNEAAKALVTGSSLFLAFYGSTVAESGVGTLPAVITLLPVLMILLGVAFCIVVLFPYQVKALAEDITAIQEYVELVLARKQAWLLAGAISLGIGVIIAFLLLLMP